MPFITVAKPEDFPEGVYEAKLVRISDPKTVTAQRGPNAGTDFDLIEWDFEILSGPMRGRVLNTSTSTASGPRSKMYGFLTALEGGRTPERGKEYEKSDLLGRAVLVTVAQDPDGWPKITNLSAMPTADLSKHVAQSTGAPTQGTPIRAADDQLPF